MAWHAIAHGADGFEYWQWRPALGGQEQYHGSLIDQSGQPRPFYAEARQIGEDIASVTGLVGGSVVRSRVAILNAYDSRWSIEFQRHHKDFDYVAYVNAWYRPLALNNVNVDVISADEDLGGYRLVIAPALVVLNPHRVENLKRFVEHGGHLVLTVRTGMKDEYNALLPSRQPGPLAALAGVEVEEYYALSEPVPVLGKWLNGTASIWAERLRILDTERTIPISLYGKSNGWLDDQAAVTVHPFGRGMVFTVGAYLDEAALQSLVNHILQVAGIPRLDSPKGVEMRSRVSKDGAEILFVINHTTTEQDVALPWPAHEHLTGQAVQGSTKLAAYGVMILTKSASAPV